MTHPTPARRRTQTRPEVVSVAVSLAVLVAVAAVIAALPTLVVLPDAIAVGARGLAVACLAVVYATGVAMQPYLLPQRRRRHRQRRRLRRSAVPALRLPARR